MRKVEITKNTSHKKEHKTRKFSYSLKQTYKKKDFIHIFRDLKGHDKLDVRTCKTTY